MCPAFQHTEQNNLRIASENPVQLRPRKLDYVGLQQIQLIDGQQLLQQYELADSENCNLPLLELLETPQRFIALLQNGLLFTADLLPSETGSKGLIQLLQPQADLKLTGMPGACFDAKRNLIWVFTRIRDQRGRGQHLLGYDLDELLNADAETDHSQPQLALKHSIAVPCDEVDEMSPEAESLTLRNDGKLALYARNDKGRFADRRQGLLLIDPDADQDNACSYLPCPFKPVPDDISIKPALFYSANTKQVFTPAADGIEITEHKGESVYSFALTALELETQSSWSQTVRRMSASQIAEEGEAENITEALANIAEGNIRSSESDEWQDYLTSLSSVFVNRSALDNNGICPDRTDTSDQIVWLAWHDGCIRALKRNPASGQVQLSALARLQTFSDKSVQPYFMNLSGGFTPVQIKALCNSDNGRQLHIRLGDDEMGQDFYADISALLGQQGQLQLFDTEQALSETEAGIILPCTPYSAEPVQIDPARQAVPSVTGRVQIETTDLDSNQGRLDALQQVLKLMPVIGQQLSQRQQPLYFAFADVMGSEQSEAQFFPYAALAKNADDEQPSAGFRLLLEIVRRYSDLVKTLPCADSAEALSTGTSSNETALNKTAIAAQAAPLRDAVITLSEHAEALPVIAQYFNTLPAEETLVDAFHISRTLPVIRELHADTTALTDFLAQLPAPYNDSSFSKPEHDPYDDWGYED